MLNRRKFLKAAAGVGAALLVPFARKARAEDEPLRLRYKVRGSAYTSGPSLDSRGACTFSRTGTFVFNRAPKYEELDYVGSLFPIRPPADGGWLRTKRFVRVGAYLAGPGVVVTYEDEWREILLA